MPRVLVTPTMLHQQPGPYRDALDAGGIEVVYPPTPKLPTSEGELTALLEQCGPIDATVCSVEPYTREVLAASRIRVVARVGVGYDSVDVAGASELGILVTNTPGANRDSVAEHAIALLLAVAHGYPARDKEARSGVWQRNVLPRLAGRTIGLVGLGAIGKATALRAKALGLTVIASDVQPDAAFAAEHDVRLCPFDELIATADVVSLHLPCTPDTIDLINADVLGRMKPGSILINTARGGLVDEDALVEALRSGHLAGAGLDVFKVEPLPAESPLTELDNALLCPHMGGIDAKALSDMAQLAAESVVALHNGDWPEGRVVNAELREGWTW